MGIARTSADLPQQHAKPSEGIEFLRFEAPATFLGGKQTELPKQSRHTRMQEGEESGGSRPDRWRAAQSTNSTRKLTFTWSQVDLTSSSPDFCAL